MVKFSSNVKRPKALLKQNSKHLSKEAPVLHHKEALKQRAINYNSDTSTFTSSNPHSSHSHSHARSLPSNPRVSVIEEVGLASSTAIKALIEEIDKCLSNSSTRRIVLNDISGIVLLIRYLNLLVMTIWGFRSLNWSLFAFSGSFLVLELIFVELIEGTRKIQVIPKAIKRIRSKLRKLDKSLLSGSVNLDELYRSDISVPFSSSLSYVRVIRDGKVRLVCSNLLVHGDFIVLLAGERANKLNFSCQPLNLILTSFQRNSIGIPVDSSIFQVEETPVSRILQDQLKFSRRTKFIFSQLQGTLQKIVNATICVLMIFSHVFSFNSISLFAPLIIVSSQLLHFFWWVISACYLSLLADQLIKSKTPFSETSDPLDIDEFDEDAPPPVKNIKIPYWKVFVEALCLIFGIKDRSGSILNFWDGDITEVLALTSVLCFIDREGSISTAHSRPCELIIPTTNQFELVAIELVPLISDPSRVRPAINNNPHLGLFCEDLRIIGLSFLLTSECGNGESSTKPHCRHGNVLSNICHFLPEHLQTCYCNMAHEIGFDSSILNRFKHVKSIWSQHSNANSKQKRSTTVTILIEDRWHVADSGNKDDPIGHLFTFGEVGDILKSSQLAFAKVDSRSKESKIVELSESLRRKLIDFEGTMRSCDINCVAFSYRPLFNDEIGAKFCDLSGNIFLGLVSVCFEPKEHFQEFVDDLEAAGIRFAYFSPLKEQPSKAFGERLGLETDWNSCILLSEHPNPASQSPGYSALSDIKARLPRGIEAIRPHLESVDDIPLHVSIFAECNNQNTSEMIRIYQETGEIVGIVGSCRSIRNTKCFGSAHFAIGCDQLCEDGLTDYSIDRIAAQINSNSFKLILPADFSPYILTELFRESRTILHNSIAAWEFLSGSLLCVFGVCLVSGCRESSLSLFVLLVALVVVSATLVLGPHDSLVMKTHSTVLDHSKCPTSISFPFFLSASLKISSLCLAPTFFGLILLSRIASFGFVSLLIVLLSQAFSFTHFSRWIGFRSNSLLTTTATIFMIVSVAFSLLFDRTSSSLNGKIISIILSFALGTIGLAWHEGIKSAHLKDYYDQLQKRSKLLFNTKLGMHSPI